MNKEEILAKSRTENKNKDIYEQEILKQSYACATKVMLIIALVFFVVQMIVGGGMNWGIWAIAYSVHATRSWVRYIKLRKKNDLCFAIAFTIFVVIASAFHIYNLIASTSIL